MSDSHRMNSSRRTTGALALAFVATTIACAQEGGGGEPPPSEDERGNVGPANPSSVYCASLGYSEQTVESPKGQEGHCVFPDKSSCEEWAFFRGECGQAFSYCNRHGGTVRNVVKNEGTWTSSQAICTLKDGTSCSEQDFAKTSVCK